MLTVSNYLPLIQAVRSAVPSVAPQYSSKVEGFSDVEIMEIIRRYSTPVGATKHLVEVLKSSDETPAIPAPEVPAVIEVTEKPKKTRAPRAQKEATEKKPRAPRAKKSVASV